jgi:PAS domain S-box-containing protein
MGSPATQGLLVVEFNIYRSESLYFSYGGDMGKDETKLTDIHMQEGDKLPFLASIVESSDDAIIGMTLDGIILSWNLGAQGAYYYPADEVTGKSISILLPPDRTDEISSLLKRAGQGESIKNFETVRIRKDGKQIDISLTMSPVKDRIGKIKGVSSISRDITERKRLEEEQRREKELSDALNNINTALNSTLDFDEIMRRVVIESMRAINAETSAILLLENNHWILKYFYGKLREQEPELVGIRFNYEQAKAVALATETAEPVILGDAYNDNRVNTELAKRYQLRSIIIIPLIAREEVIGNVSFAYHSAPVDFKKAEIDFSRKLATSISLAIQNARLFEEQKHTEEALKKERDRAQNYLNIAGVMIIVINTDQKVTLVNKKCSEVLGYKEQEIIDRNWFDTFIPERARDEVRAAFMKLITGEIKPVEYFEYPILTREGTKRLIAWHNSVLRDDAGNITGTLSSGEDITERRQIEEKLHESEIRYRTLFEQSPDGILIVDPQTSIAIEFNEIAHRQLGYTREEFKKLRISDYEAKEKPEETKAHIEKMLREGRDDFETIHRTKGGKPRNVMVTIKTIELSGRMVFHDIFRDITDLKRTEEELKRSKEVSDALNRINMAINSTLDFDEIMQKVVVEAGKAIGSDSCIITLHEDDYWIVKYAYGMTQEVTGIRLTEEEAQIAMLTAKTKKPLVIKDVYTDERVWIKRRLIEKYGVHSILAAPLIVKDKLIGVLYFSYYYVKPTFSQTEIDFAEKLSASVSLAIQNARLFSELEKRAKTIEALYDVDRVVSQSLDLSTIFRDSLSKALEVTEIDAGGIFLLEEEGETLTLKHYQGISPELAQTFSKVKVGVGVGGMAIKSGKPVVVEVEKYPRSQLHSLLVKNGIFSIISTPLSSKGRAIGTFTFISRRQRSFSQDDLDLIASIGNQIGVAVENAHLYEKSKQSEELSKALNNINLTINSILDFDEIMRRVIMESAKAIGCETALITLREGDYWVARYIYGFSEELIGSRFTDEEVPHGALAAQSKQPVVINDTYNDNRVNREIMERYGVRSVLVTPLIVRERVIGNIYYNYHSAPTAFAPSKVDFTEKLAASATLALENSRLYAERELYITELARSNAELEQFAYIASHDLQEPLRMISGFTQLLARRYKDRLDKDANEFIAFIINGTARMQRMIEDLLAYSRVGTRGKPFEPTNLEDIFNQAVANLKAIIEENKAIVTHESLPAVMADASQMIQLFQNLIANAIKFRKKQEPPRIHVSVQRKGDEWICFVRDNGIGITPEFMGHLFQLFQREHPAGEYPGTGIGLAICRRIVERHGGRIWVESEPGKGSTFYFTIPHRQW